MYFVTRYHSMYGFWHFSILRITVQFRIRKKLKPLLDVWCQVACRRNIIHVMVDIVLNYKQTFRFLHVISILDAFMQQHYCTYSILEMGIEVALKCATPFIVVTSSVGDVQSFWVSEWSFKFYFQLLKLKGRNPAFSNNTV